MKTGKQDAGTIRLMILSLSLFLFGCRSMEIGLKEKFGVPKRSQMVTEVAKARDAQNEAKEQVASALEQFSTELRFEGGDLEKKYKTLSSEYEKSRSKASAVSSRIERVKEVSEALFREWEKELTQYSSDRLRESSRRKLDQTRRYYETMMAAMERARDKMDPVLAAFRDQVLFLKHNLNARAVASLRQELNIMESEVAVLIREMEASISEANRFIEQLTQEEP
ncbi:MAG TPA: DUF2959 domain-containing protein [Anaerohalosphaeraceae bacterium]|nr:DUF2959 domain-containing protein [Anaerohalosphaeraceae bacterium]